MKPLSRTVPPSLTMELDRQARALLAAGRDVINLTAGQVDLPMPLAGKAAVRAALERDKTGYVPATGSPEVKAAVREKMGWQAGEILIGAGAKPLLHAALMCLLGPGEEALLPVPCYTSYPEMIRLTGAEAILVATDQKAGWKLTRAALEAHVTDRTKVLLLNHPVNPTGAAYDRDALREIVDFCLARDLYLVADEVYANFVYDGPFVSLYAFAEVRDRLILVNSASKTYAMAGLRLGYAVAPAPVARAMGGYLSQAVGCPCSLSEQAAVAALRMDSAYEQDLRAAFKARRDLLRGLLKDLPGLDAGPGEGAFYLWLCVFGYEDDLSFCRKLLEQEGVALTPGSAFACPGYARLAYTKKEPQLREAAARLMRFIQKNYSSSSAVSS